MNTLDNCTSSGVSRIFTDAQAVTRGLCIDIQLCRDMYSWSARTYTHAHPFPISEKKEHAHACMRIQFPSHERKADDECEQAMLGETLLRKFEGAKLESQHARSHTCVSSSRLMKKRPMMSVSKQCSARRSFETLQRRRWKSEHARSHACSSISKLRTKNSRAEYEKTRTWESFSDFFAPSLEDAAATVIAVADTCCLLVCRCK